MLHICANDVWHARAVSSGCRSTLSSSISWALCPTARFSPSSSVAEVHAERATAPPACGANVHIPHLQLSTPARCIRTGKCSWSTENDTGARAMASGGSNVCLPQTVLCATASALVSATLLHVV